ncbi:pyruvate kinase [uncultured Desulfovibrio sp.]|uniref:pyruvate kinase n=1 Tax=uncultured Desulfovibrio sp. TaxID=167968 RepID=UPI00261085DA|nr:pyruvate kinase [uncultured Desulfovibrio sp.]
MKTKIVATIGPASNTKEKLRALAEEGVSIFRLNFSHGTAADFVTIIGYIREVEKELNKPITIMQDLSGPKIRLGVVEEGAIQVAKGMKLLLGLTSQRPDKSDLPFLPFDHAVILETLERGDCLVLADGGLQFTVQERRSDDLVVLEANNSGIVTSRKGLALPGKATKVRALTEKDKRDLADGLALGVDAVAISYVQTADDVREAKKLIADAGRDVPVVVKLERQSAVDNLDEILAETDIIMVARGDLGVECPLPKLPGLQKRIIRACNNASKPVIVATQMLLSMVNSPAPTRAETTDVANAVLDGADCVMMSEETAMGNFPVETVRYMRRITGEAEKLLLERRKAEEPDAEKGIPEYLAYSACLLADKAHATAIVAHSVSGASARLLSSCRPSQDIYALTPDPGTIKRMNFSWGVVPVAVEKPQIIASHLERAEHFIAHCDAIAPGESAVITAGQQTGSSKATPRGTNLVKIYWK